jgi:hypothetical protein
MSNSALPFPCLAAPGRVGRRLPAASLACSTPRSSTPLSRPANCAALLCLHQRNTLSHLRRAGTPPRALARFARNQPLRPDIRPSRTLELPTAVNAHTGPDVAELRPRRPSRDDSLRANAALSPSAPLPNPRQYTSPLHRLRITSRAYSARPATNLESKHCPCAALAPSTPHVRKPT